MKAGILSLFTGISLFVFSGCSNTSNSNKSSKTEESSTSTSTVVPLSGTTSWKEVGYFYSIGGPEIQWHYPSPDSAEIIRLGDNNVFYSSQQTNLDRYRLDTTEKPTLMEVFKEGSTDTIRWHLKQIAADTIEISFVCTEACGKKFARYQEK